MTLTALIDSYGYYALFVGTFLEGETVLIAAGFTTHRGILELPWVIAIAFIASTLRVVLLSPHMDLIAESIRNTLLAEVT